MSVARPSTTRTSGGVLHVLPYDRARGAQRYARALVDALDSDAERHVILTLFAADPVLLRPDFQLDVPRGMLRRLGFDPRVLLRLHREVRRLRPAVLVAHGGESAKYAALAVPRRLPLIYYKIGTVHPKSSRRLRGALHRFYSRRANAIAAVSGDVADEARRLLRGVGDVVVIPNARDPRDFPPPAEKQPGPPRVVFVGFLNPGKRPGWFIDAVAALRGRGVELEAMLIGGGPLEKAIRPAAESAGVVMVGSRDDVPRLMAESDVFVFPSLPAGEGMPGVLIEAGLSGLATVSTRVPGARDVVEEGVTGLLVDIDDKRGFIEAVGRLVTDEELRRSMGERARQRCLRRFTLEASARRWRGLLSQLESSVSGADQKAGR